MFAECLSARIASLVSQDPEKPEESFYNVFRLADGTWRAELLGELLLSTPETAIDVLADAAAQIYPALASEGRRRDMAHRVLERVLGCDPELTGAEAVAALLAAAGTRAVFAYPGTSELALCDAMDRCQALVLINGRGDKEAAFMAAGASLLKPCLAAAVLHGARGMTNACGAIADVRRNEIAAIYVAGLPSTSSARFLPPHGEPDLMGTMDAFAGWCWEAGPVPEAREARAAAAREFITKFQEGIAAAETPPYQPTLFGVPQDVAEARWIPASELISPFVHQPAVSDDDMALDQAARMIAAAVRPLFLVDDYALRYPGIKPSLDTISQATGAPVLQVRYRRGPMLFERIHHGEVKNFAGWMNQFDPVHAAMLADCDLLITVEDRNMYQRVVGDLPDCPKIALNSDPEKVLKNEYLLSSDVIVAGDPAITLAELAECLSEAVPSPATPWFPPEAKQAAANPEPPTPRVAYGRRALAVAIAGSLARWPRPVLVDDSQMFGGLMSEHYDSLPLGIRVFGGHGGFVGSGLPIATGLAIVDGDVQVMCLLGDQAFTNSFQGLVAAVEKRARVLFLVCNNGESVSLKKQANAALGGASRTYLSNTPGLDYSAIANAIGVRSYQVVVPVGADEPDVDRAIMRLSSIFADIGVPDGPLLIEVILPSDPDIWRGVWITQGFEQQKIEIAS